MDSKPQAVTIRSATRRIGVWGTVARVCLGTALLFVAAGIGITLTDLSIGLVGLPVAVMVVQALRGRSAPELRLFGPTGYAVNYGVGLGLLLLVTLPALLFYGVSMLLAAFRGYAGCEIFAIPNWLSGRNDKMACPVFSPIDAAEARQGRASSVG